VLDDSHNPGLIVTVIAAKPRSAPATWKTRRWTFDELVAELPESNLPTELWDGELIMSPAPSFLHQEIVDRFHDLIKAWVRQHQLGKTALAPIDMVLTTRRATQPDVVFSRRGLSPSVGGSVQGVTTSNSGAVWAKCEGFRVTMRLAPLRRAKVAWSESAEKGHRS